MTKFRALAAVSVAALALSACGGDDDGGGSPQDEVADMMIDAIESGGAEMEGVEVDEDCLRDLTDDLSDEDAEKIIAAGPEGDPGDLSADADAIGNEIIDCFDIDLSAITEDG
jgi:ABC-type glycerol-3-phosphate transport system substrate-binding protein